MEFLYLFIGLALGFVIAWLLFRNGNTDAAAQARVQELDKTNAALQAQLTAQQQEQQRNSENAQREKQQQQQLVQQASDKVAELTGKLASREAELQAMDKRLAEQKTELENLQKKLTAEFENLANRIFEDKSQKFAEQNKTSLDDLLKPLSEKIKDFEKKVNDVYVNETRERASLKEQLVQLHQLNQQMSQDAQNLTRALKGESKTQGSWGEIILENILEKSGLVRDREFTVQPSFTTDDGRRQFPDVVIHLPEDRHIVIDSKVALTAYERFNSAENEAEKAAFLKEHLDAVRRHIRSLSEKRYQDIYPINSPDYVLLFIANEPAFNIAMQADQGLFNFAIEYNVLLVTPTTLLASLRMVAQIWRQENQNRNVIRIAEEAEKMYDKFVGLAEELLKLGRSIDTTKKSYDDAMNRLSTGNGNVIRRIGKLKELGLKVKKNLPQELLDKSDDDDDTNENTES
jgi:DNA recombination protein RmuC